MEICIKELYKIEERDHGRFYKTLFDAFRDYPKLIGAYPGWDDRQAAIEMVIRYYGAYDLFYGSAFSLDEGINEVLAVVHSDEMDYSDERCKAADCENGGFRAAASKLSRADVKKWWEFFEELDRQEAMLKIPRPHLYVDYLGVRKDRQREGRGSRLIRALCDYASEQGLPVMLFTNGEDDVRFYLNMDFKVIGMTRSVKFGFENTYMLYEA